MNLHIEPQGSTLEKSIIRILNFLTSVVYEKIVKSNQNEIESSKSEILNIERQNIENIETMLDMRFENEALKEQVMNQLETQIDLKFELELLKDKNGG